MARKVFVAATGQNSGKTTTSLSLMYMARKKYKRVGFIKPFGPKPSIARSGMVADKDAVLMAEVFGLEEDLSLMSPLVLHPGDTQKLLEGELSGAEMERKMFDAIDELDRKNDFLIIEGAGHTGVGSVLGFSNARVAKIADAPVVMVTGGGVGNVVDSAYMNLALFEKEQADVRAVLVNKIIPEKREKTLRYLELAFAKETFKVVGGFNYQPILANPTLRRISQVLDVPLHGNQEAAGQIAHHVQIGSAATQRVTELLKESSLVTVTSSRDELLVTLANMYNLPEYRYLLAGLVIPGVAKISAITQKILDNSGIPYMRTTRTTADVFNTITDDVSKLNAMDTQKINLIMELADKRFEFDALDSLLG
ncbi:MAG TPA: AAA family ATPase [Desulfuromonadales bacterium]|nr:dethiobiotin synthase [Desulfuromonadales bacterium]HKJ29599.1 AAA family ATPase [Desulfuromonadales bacterium]